MSTHTPRTWRWRLLTQQLRARADNCGICGQPIDYTLHWPHPHSFSADHIHPASTHPHLALDPTNTRAAHLHCNTSRGARATHRTTPRNSEDW